MYELAIETLDMYFDTQRSETLKNLPDPNELVEILREKGADNPEKRVEAIEFAFGNKKIPIKKDGDNEVY